MFAGEQFARTGIRRLHCAGAGASCSQDGRGRCCVDTLDIHPIIKFICEGQKSRQAKKTAHTLTLLLYNVLHGACGMCAGAV